MTIKIKRAGTEALIRECLEPGHFRDVDELLFAALGALKERGFGTSKAPANAEHRKPEGQKNLVEVCAMVKGLTDDVDFGRSPTTGRPMNLT